MDELDFAKGGGLLPAIVQDDVSGEVLMLAYLNQAAWQATIDTGKATFYSRSRQQLWVKGATSGNTLRVKEIRIDCDQDTVLLKVDPIGGAACHTGYKSCFHRRIEKDGVKTVETPVFDPREVYKK